MDNHLDIRAGFCKPTVMCQALIGISPLIAGSWGGPGGLGQGASIVGCNTEAVSGMTIYQLVQKYFIISNKDDCYNAH